MGGQGEGEPRSTAEDDKTMTRKLLETLVEGNRFHVQALPKKALADVEEAQQPKVVSICCSDSRVSQEGMFDVSDPGFLFSPSSIGNQVTDLVDGERVVDGSLLYPIHHTGTRTIVVVGHTGCGAIEAAYEAHQGGEADLAPGIAKHVDMLAPIVAHAFSEELVDEEAEQEAALAQLVEVNVHEQVRLLRESPEIPGDADVYGFVYDLTGAYGGPRGRSYIVNENGNRDVKRLRSRLDEGLSSHVATLLD